MAIQLSREQIVKASISGMELLTGQLNSRQILASIPNLIVLRTILSSVISGEASIVTAIEKTAPETVTPLVPVK